MSAKARCKVCLHVRGPRRISFGESGVQKKAACLHECHVKVEAPDDSH